jgi:microcystin-dependent protein
MADPFIGQIALFPYNFAPKGWADCDGSLLPISLNTALFSILGTTYGGNGQTTFGLPALNNVPGLSGGRVMAGMGQGPGLTNRVLGEVGGEEAHVLTASEMPAHTHTLTIGTAATTAHAVPVAGDVLVDPLINTFLPAGNVGATTALHTSAVAPAGGGQAHDNNQPVQAMRWCIALTGIFPSRN